VNAIVTEVRLASPDDDGCSAGPTQVVMMFHSA